MLRPWFNPWYNRNTNLGLNEGDMSQDGSAISRAIHHAGGQVLLSRAVGVSQQVVSKWNVRGWAPADRADAIAKATGWAVRADDLRADVPR
ncbi:MAG: YdaS family helix-turn-helix protein [Xanthomonadales bacterium]|nr:YdaS family helix-turn-helix protein [Xanthomonadales bacterium]